MKARFDTKGEVEISVETRRDYNNVEVGLHVGPLTLFYLTKAEARALGSALMGAAAEL